MTKEEFLKGVSNWDNHRHLLWEALERTKASKAPVLELGCGDGSTPFLKAYCAANGLELFSYDYNADWAAKFGATHVTNWATQAPWRKEFSVALVDESPGEHRKESLKLLHHVAIVVIHDSEPAGWNSSDYQVRGQIEKFKYVRDLPGSTGGAWASMMSNFIDIR